MVDHFLRAKARQLIQSRTFPSRLPARRWGGPGSGAPCMLCGAPVKDDEVGFEIEFGCNDKSPASHDFHVQCLEALELELRERDLGDGRAPASAHLQPAGATTVDGPQAEA